MYRLRRSAHLLSNLTVMMSGAFHRRFYFSRCSTYECGTASTKKFTTPSPARTRRRPVRPCVCPAKGRSRLDLQFHRRLRVQVIARLVGKPVAHSTSRPKYFCSSVLGTVTFSPVSFTLPSLASSHCFIHRPILLKGPIYKGLRKARHV